MNIRQTDYGIEATLDSGTDAVVWQWDTRATGWVRGVRIGKKVLVRENNSPALSASVLETPDYDGISDFAGRDGGTIRPAQYRLQRCDWRQVDRGLDVVSEVRLEWDGGDALDVALRSTLNEAGHLQVSASVKPVGRFEHRYLRELALELPLALDVRKRVVQPGDRGIRFDTRSLYTYHAHTDFLNDGDFNFWQHFQVDQNSPCDYHLWRSESLATAGLSLFRGRVAPGWMTAYDCTGGILMAYRGMAQRAPKSLKIGARDGGVARICLHPATHRALRIDDARSAERVFITHEMDFIFFAGAEAQAKPDHALARAWGAEPTVCDGLVRADEALDRIDLLTASLSADADAPLVAGGVPLPRGEITSADQLALFRDDRPVALQTRPLAYWPDGSIKWAILILPLDGGRGSEGGSDASGTTSAPAGKSLPLSVTLRRAPGAPERVPFVLRYGAGAKNPPVDSTMKVARIAERHHHRHRPAAAAHRPGRALAAGGRAQRCVDPARRRTAAGAGRFRAHRGRIPSQHHPPAGRAGRRRGGD